MNARNKRPESKDTSVFYSDEDLVQPRREVETEGWASAGRFFYDGLRWLAETALEIIAGLATAIEARSTYHELNGLSDAALAERGLTRGDIVGHVAAMMAGGPVTPRPAQGDLFAIDGRSPANTDHPAMTSADRRAA